MKKIFDEFTKCYPVSKTLRFTLIPQGKTEAWIVKNGILDNDEEKANTYDYVKLIFDGIHKQIIEDVLNNVDISFEPLFKAFTEYQSSKDDKQKMKNYQDKQKALQKKISGFFPKFKEINSTMLIRNILKGEYSIPKEDINKVRLFSKFATYFTKYDKTRENIYAADKPTSVAYRIVSDNFPMFYYNYKIITSLPEDIITPIQKQMQDVLKGQTIYEIFSPQNYKNVLSQSQITFYNSIIGGVSDNETSKRQGLNEYLNLQFQQGKLTKRIRLKGLYKQILSDSASLSFIPTPYENDTDVKNDINVLCENLMKFDKSVFEEIFKGNDNDDTKIYVDKKQISVLSKIIFDNNWHELGSKLKKKDLYTLSEIKESVQDIDVMDIVCEKVESGLGEFYKNYEKVKELTNNDGKILSYADIKNLLDSIQNIEKILKIFCASYDAEKDITFYGLFDEVYEAYRSNIPIYNKVRNYAVKKPYSTEKIKLNFDNPTFVEGWDINKENDYLGVIFTKDEKFYLGIKRKRNLKWEFTEDSKNFCYKMIYKQIPNGAKYFSRKQICSKNSNPPKNIVRYLSDGFDKKQMSKEELAELIDYVINDFIPNYKPLHNENGEPYFNFNFKKPEEYESWNEFCKDAEKQAYKIYFKKVSTECINKAVENGDLYLFEIYNKDFSAKSTGRPNLHTLYWKEVFSEENLQNVVFKLNGGAEVFYRPASIENPFVHKKGSVLIKKIDRYNKPVDEETYLEAFKDASEGMDISALSVKYPTLLFRTAPHDIIKDKRYAKNAFALHVPIIINDVKNNKYSKFNEAVLSAIKDDEDINIIGIDRGERNLLYISCINRHGEILEQK